MINKQNGLKLFIVVAFLAGIYFAYGDIPDYNRQRQDFSDIGVTPDSIYLRTNNISLVRIGLGDVHYYCPNPIYVHIGNATMVLREINGIIYIEGPEVVFDHSSKQTKEET